MSEIEALPKESCPACGAHAVWNPAKQVLVCSYCGTEAPWEADPESGEIREIDLAQTLRELGGDARGWQAEKRSVRCQHCKAVSVFDATRAGQRCEFCGSPKLVDYQEIRAPLRPRSLLPFRIDETSVRESMRRWYAGKWLAPGALKVKALLDTARGVYVPYWTFDAEVYCQWRAESGTYSYTTGTFYDSKGQLKSRSERRVRWERVSGTIETFFDDEPVPGTHGVHLDLLRKVEPFPTPELVPYDTAYLSGFVVEHYQVVLIDAVRKARESMRAKLRERCSAQIPGDTYRNLELSVLFSGETFKLILVPVWLLAYQFRHRSYQVVVNGYTGKIAGEYPLSIWKVSLIAFFVVLIVGIAFVLSQGG